MAEQTDGDQFSARLIWLGLDDMPIYAANQFMGQVERDEIVVSLGSYTPPVIFGTPEERREQALNIGYVPVRPVTRIILTRQRLEELLAVLDQTRKNYDDSHDGGGPR